MNEKVHDAITPGEILLTEFLEPLGISQYRLAQATGLPQTRISEIVHGKACAARGAIDNDPQGICDAGCRGTAWYGVVCFRYGSS